ncbi:hypothetical protein [Neomoorella mulderi]|uniref:Uncharacterized protein n=1 Tax=Moorella mulderi DSM 14980 TaxID=1122241 RepID=A0A151ATM9_9FIRM|nr:hypothetical protein [Moorella mulderi]KYH30971.1 hypothetical protein MOMUL_27550 [Moorella mulderi DSM 14980]
MQMQLQGANIVVVLSQPNKNAVRVNEILGLYPGEPHTTLWFPDPISPGVIEFPNKGIGISLTENRLQIQSRVNDNFALNDFSEILMKVLHLTGGQAVNAYGFNFDFICSGLPEVKDIFSLAIKPTSFENIPNTALRLSFTKDNVLFTLDLADDKPNLKLHINIHHNESLNTDILAQRTSETLENDWNNSQKLIAEVIGSGNTLA